jgi:DNA-binding transcriptional regulator YiaG
MSVIKGPEDDGVMKLVMRTARNTVRAEADLRAIKLFDVLSDAGKVVAKRTQNRVKTSAMNQILLEHRDNYVKCIERSDKYEAAFTRLEKDLVETKETDGRTLVQMMALISKNSAEGTKHLENMGKNVSTQMDDQSKASNQMQKLMKDVSQTRLQQQQHNDRMEILEASTWAQVEQKTGMSRAEIEAEMYEDEDEGV